MAEGGGAGLVIDYGGDRSFSDSVRGFRKHKVVDLFEEPGTADLTANVDFAYLRESLEGVAETAGPMSQAKFLLSLGLEPRLAKLLSSAADPEQRKRIQDGAKRLVDKTGMGTQYQVMAVVKGPAGEDDVYPFDKPPKAAPEAPKAEETQKS
jgi:NADH dehydrogenase [ubiquinone] 1 alpha subcomplex assembly factor 7